MSLLKRHQGSSNLSIVNCTDPENNEVNTDANTVETLLTPPTQKNKKLPIWKTALFPETPKVDDPYVLPSCDYVKNCTTLVHSISSSTVKSSQDRYGLSHQRKGISSLTAISLPKTTVQAKGLPPTPSDKHLTKHGSRSRLPVPVYCDPLISITPLTTAVATNVKRAAEKVNKSITPLKKTRHVSSLANIMCSPTRTLRPQCSAFDLRTGKFVTHVRVQNNEVNTDLNTVETLLTPPTQKNKKLPISKTTLFPESPKVCNAPSTSPRKSLRRRTCSFSNLSSSCETVSLPSRNLNRNRSTSLSILPRPNKVERKSSIYLPFSRRAVCDDLLETTPRKLLIERHSSVDSASSFISASSFSNDASTTCTTGNVNDSEAGQSGLHKTLDMANISDSPTCDVIAATPTRSISQETDVFFTPNQSFSVDQLEDGEDLARPITAVEISGDLNKGQSSPSFEDSAKKSVSLRSALRQSAACSKRESKLQFNQVMAYYFDRRQGSDTVPTSGEIALGMADDHFTSREFSLTCGRRPILSLLDSGVLENDEEISDEHCSTRTIDRYDEKVRIGMLRRSGVRPVRPCTQDSNDVIRQSRAICGCSCRDICEATTCECALNGIECQVDNPYDENGDTHPCRCRISCCINPLGQNVFDSASVSQYVAITIRRHKDAEKVGATKAAIRTRFDSEIEDDTMPAKIVDASFTTPPHPDEDRTTLRYPVTPVYPSRISRISESCQRRILNFAESE